MYRLQMQGIGLPMEEALAFWRAEFAQKTPAEKFNKEYAYGVRHNYGKEGGRKDYTPYSCLKIISTTPGVVRDVMTRGTFDQTIRDLTQKFTRNGTEMQHAPMQLWQGGRPQGLHPRFLPQDHLQHAGRGARWYVK